MKGTGVNHLCHALNFEGKLLSLNKESIGGGFYAHHGGAVQMKISRHMFPSTKHCGCAGCVWASLHVKFRKTTLIMLGLKWLILTTLKCK